MANPTTNYSFAMPTNTDLVKDLPADFEVFGQAVDTQMKTNADAATQKATLTTTGDIYYASAANTPARLGIGTTGQVLQVSGGLPAWGTAPAGGMTLLSTTTLSGVTTTISSISQSYNSLFILVYGVTGNTSNSRVRGAINGAATNHKYQEVFNGAAANGADSAIFFVPSSTLRTSANNAWVLKIDNYTSTTNYKPFTFQGTFTDASSTLLSVNSGGAFSSNSAVTSFTVDYGGTNTLAGGTCLIYGVK